MKAYLVETHGVPYRRILTDCQAKDTIQNALLVAPLCVRLGIRSITVITSDFHLPRSKFYFDQIFDACVRCSCLVAPNESATALACSCTRARTRSRPLSLTHTHTLSLSLSRSLSLSLSLPPRTPPPPLSRRAATAARSTSILRTRASRTAWAMRSAATAIERSAFSLCAPRRCCATPYSQSGTKAQLPRGQRGAASAAALG